MSELKEELIEKVLLRIRAESGSLKMKFRNLEEGFAKVVIIDDLLPSELAMKCYQELVSCVDWRSTNDHRESKKVNQNIDQVGVLSSTILDLFHDPRIIKEIGEITLIDELKADPSLYAGGISKMVKGSFLNPHIDNSHNRDRTMFRRLNLLFYVTPGLTLDDGASLNLWDEKVLVSKEVESSFNRMVIMVTDKNSWHSVSPMISNKERYCISNYYFSPASASGTNYYHVTSFMGRPEQSYIRLISAVDNLARQTMAQLFGGRGTRRARQT